MIVMQPFALMAKVMSGERVYNPIQWIAVTLDNWGLLTDYRSHNRTQIMSDALFGKNKDVFIT